MTTPDPFVVPDVYWYKAVVSALGVHDGDTLFLDVDQGFHEWHHDMKIRLARINAPELKIKDATGAWVDNPPGIEAGDYLRLTLPVGTKVILHSLKDQSDKYGGRWDGEIFIGSTNVNDLMVRAGHAVPYP